jgi:hypothetical protein
VRANDGIGKLYNVEGAIGGPIKKDKIWYFASARNLDSLPAGRRAPRRNPSSAWTAHQAR